VEKKPTERKVAKKVNTVNLNEDDERLRLAVLTLEVTTGRQRGEKGLLGDPRKYKRPCKGKPVGGEGKGGGPGGLPEILALGV